MPGLLKLFINLAIIAIGVLISRRHRSLADSIACGLGLFCIAIGLVIVASGVFHEPSLMSSLHHWTGHGITIAIWCSCLFTLGVAAQQTKSRGLGILAARLTVVVFVLIFGFICSITGYLGPEHDPELPRDSHNRFIVLHMFVLPTILAILLGLWCKLFLPKGQSQNFFEPSEPR